MSRHRTRPDSGYHYDGTPRSVHPCGRPSCRWCKGPVPKPRRTFCGADCVDRWKMRTSPGYVRSLVWARDKGICAACGVDAVAWHRSIRARVSRQMKAAGLVRPKKVSRDRGRKAAPSADLGADLVARIERAAYRALGIDAGRAHSWEADHVVPVAEGGGECDLDNLQTLCLRCHKRATRELAGRRALARRVDAPSPG